jgi:hypothetical protein
MLILSQKENAIKVKGMSGWNYLGRSVNPGEKGIKIIVPIIKKVEKEKLFETAGTGMIETLHDFEEHRLKQ